VHPRLSLLALSLALAGCPTREGLGTSSMSVLGSGVVNDPANKSLRFDLLKFGLESFCEEMLKGGTPLKFSDDQPVIGRFFAAGCQTQILDEEHRKSFIVQYQGKGYAYGNPVGRIGFEAAGLIEYAPDFQLHEGALYVYFRPRLVDTSSFKTLMFESAATQTALGALGVNPESLGKRIVDSQLRRGFTVVRLSSKGETEFGMGIIPKGERPFHPFQVETADKRVLVNERTEVYPGQQDFVGAFTIEGSGQALYLTLSVDGAPSINAVVVPEALGAPLIDAYVKERGPRPIQGAVLDEAAPAGQAYRRFVPLPAGRYYLVLDHGRGAQPGANRAAKVDYLLMAGDAP
jgi:hypothetical protein